MKATVYRIPENQLILKMVNDNFWSAIVKHTAVLHVLVEEFGKTSSPLLIIA